MSEAPQPELIFLAGPNGAGKSTFFEHHLRATGLRFINSDLIARAIAPDAAMAASYVAARAADLAARALLERRESFCLETVFSDPHGAKLGLLREAKAAGYFVRLVFIGLESPQLSQARVVGRVAQGGHDVPDEKLFTRFGRTLKNLEEGAELVDEAWLFDNSDAGCPFRLVARLHGGRISELHPPIPWWAERVVG